MDSKLVKQYGSEILSYRLRTVRQKKRMQYEDFDKQLSQTGKEERRLIRQNRTLGWEPLTPPVQKGWKRFFVLRDDVAYGKHAAFFENILRKINTYDWSYRKDFMIRKGRYGKNKFGVKPQSLLRPHENHFLRLGFTDDEKQFFYEELVHYGKNHFAKRYIFSEPWRFVLRVRPNIIDKVKKRDIEIERRLKEIDNYLDGNHYRGRMNRLLYGTDWNSRLKEERLWEKSVLKNKPLPRILDECAQDLL
ncbi:hypothetical protein Niako_6737 [Niastella koreensis GR20-10]|uniref:Uncharacterized protein n=2 Tax=Niastella koreensis TaxID=354356 RepID=G8TK23_NIAKG|nr:hypothetical protein [Niastella koreensis]AEW02961.1 hypothetical protein Niako_6737 [Niastella koreensis GR20-10]